MKKQIIRALAAMLCLCMTLSYYDSFSQCGAAPTSGLNTISAAGSIVNTYYAGRANATSGSKTVPVNAADSRSTAPGLSNGDMVLIIQMQGADITSDNDNSYGDNGNGDPGSGYSTTNLVAGYYEYNIVSSYNGTNQITLTYPLLRTYYSRAYATNTGMRTFQVIRVPRDYDLNIPSGYSITAPAWDGSTGGMVVLNVTNKLTLNGTINVDGKGFRGGGGKFFDGVSDGNSSTNQTGRNATDIENTDYRFNSPITNSHNTTGGAKGEGIAGTPAYVLPMGAKNAITNTVEGYVGGSMGRGAPGNAGGGGTDGKPSTNEYNPGGGGGANGGDGGKGGSGWDGGNHNKNKYPYGGFGGKAFAQLSEVRFVMGGGGGAGTGNNSETGKTDYISSGGCGGGIVLIRAKYFSGNGTISANGAAALDQDVAGITDAAGGGGAGGSIIVMANNPITAGSVHNIKASANGGKGGDMSAHFAHGPGGGGGGGYVATNIIPGSSITVDGAASGRTKATSTSDPVDDPYGSTAGLNGVKDVSTKGSSISAPGSPALPCGTLPVTISNWSGVYKNNKTYLNWQSEYSSDFSHYIVERSIDGVYFSPLGEVAAVSSSTFAQQYSFEDAFPANGVNYYRLKMVDLNGQYSYSGVLIIRTNGSGIQIAATPNPFTDHVVISIQSTTDEPANLRVFNSDGKLVWRKTTYVNAGTSVQYFNELQSLPKGVYILKVNKGNTTGEFKMIKQ